MTVCHRGLTKTICLQDESRGNPVCMHKMRYLKIKQSLLETSKTDTFTDRSIHKIPLCRISRLQGGFCRGLCPPCSKASLSSVQMLDLLT